MLQTKAKPIYLCGPINGRTDGDCKMWREIAEKLWPGPTYNPMIRDYRGREHEEGIETEIVEGDKEDIDKCAGLFVLFDKPSVGTAMEVFYSWQMGKPIVVLNASGKPVSPWLRYHATAIVNGEPSAQNIRDALAALHSLLV